VIGGCGKVMITGYGEVGVVVYARNVREAQIVIQLAAWLYASKEIHGRQRAT